jgi:hypothetical protein
VPLGTVNTKIIVCSLFSLFLLFNVKSTCKEYCNYARKISWNCQNHNSNNNQDLVKWQQNIKKLGAITKPGNTSTFSTKNTNNDGKTMLAATVTSIIATTTTTISESANTESEMISQRKVKKKIWTIWKLKSLLLLKL